MIENILHEIPIYSNGFNPHEFMVMPNHFYGIIKTVGANPRAYPKKTHTRPTTVGADPRVCPKNNRVCPKNPIAHPNNEKPHQPKMGEHIGSPLHHAITQNVGADLCVCPTIAGDNGQPQGVAPTKKDLH